MNKLTDQFSLQRLFYKPIDFEFRPEASSQCCGTNLSVSKTTKRRVVTFALGESICYETFLFCSTCQTRFESKDIRKLVPDGAIFGFDLIVLVGESLFIDYLNVEQIQNKLTQRGIIISKREISYLGDKFIIYLALAHRHANKLIKKYLFSKGGYVLHLDGTCEGDTPQLISAMDEISSLVLGNVKLPSEKAATLIPFLEKLKSDYGVPLALVHDMGSGIIDAVTTVFPGTPDYICHFHFLRDIGKDLINMSYQLFSKELKKTKVKSCLTKYVKNLGLANLLFNFTSCKQG